MEKLVCRSVSLVLMVLAGCFTCAAQQSSSRKTIPSLSSDGVLVSRSSSLAEVSWPRYSPEGFGVSFELPGDAIERPYPVPAELQPKIKEAKVFDYADERLVVNIGHMVFSQRMDLKRLAEDVRASLYRSSRFRNLKISLVPKGDRVLMEGTYVTDGRETDLRGFFLMSNAEAWLILVHTLREDREIEAVRSRILDSIKRNH